MSWLARSIANSLKLDDDNEQDTKSNHETNPSSESQSPRGGGVKEDLSEITKTLARQFWGVASFLAPTPQISQTESKPSDQEVTSEPAGIDGIRSDFAEIGGKFKTEISKIASNLLQFGSDENEGWSGNNAVGVTEEVLGFVRNVALHPETWLDFPLPDNDDDDDFDMSDAQQEHALAVERLVPELAALRFELCPGYISECCFWKIYFVLVHPRLDKRDAELLSTTQIVEARAMLTGNLQNRYLAQPEPHLSGTDASYSKQVGTTSHEESLSVPSGARTETVPFKTSNAESAATTGPVDLETEKHPDPIMEIQIVDKSVVEEESVNLMEHQKPLSGAYSRVVEDKDEDDGDDWLKEETSEAGANSGINIPILSNDEDVSFSDLEEDDGDMPAGYKKDRDGSDSSTKDSQDWVQLSRSSSDSAKDNR